MQSMNHDNKRAFLKLAEKLPIFKHLAEKSQKLGRRSLIQTDRKKPGDIQICLKQNSRPSHSPIPEKLFRATSAKAQVKAKEELSIAQKIKMTKQIQELTKEQLKLKRVPLI